MPKPVIVFVALVALYVVITASGWNLPGLALTLLLLAGIVLAPFRAFQALAGASGARPPDLRGVSILFLLALLFPFVYGLAEVLLFKVRKSRPKSPLPGGTGEA